MAFDFDAVRNNALVASPILDHLPDVDKESHVILTPDDPAGTWDDVLANNPGVRDIILLPGDYTHLGPLELRGNHPPAAGGTMRRKRTIRLDYPDPSWASSTAPMAQMRTQHPVNLAPTMRARVGGVSVRGVSNWMLSGLWLADESGVAVSSDFGHDYRGITIDMCLVERSRAVEAIRLRGGTRGIVQRCVVRDSEQAIGSDGKPSDRIGITCKPIGNDRPVAVVDARILDCEVYDCTDAFQATHVDDLPDLAASCVVEGCDFYFDRRPPFFMENLVDLKVGDRGRKSAMRNCRCWASHGPDANFTGFTIHQRAQNWTLEQLVVDGWPTTVFGETYATSGEAAFTGSRKITITSSLVHRAQRVFKIRSNLSLSEVWGVDCRAMVSNETNPVDGFGPRFRRNIRAGTTGIMDPDPDPTPALHYVYSEPPNVVFGGELRWGYCRRRWTGPEFALVSKGPPAVGP